MQIEIQAITKYFGAVHANDGISYTFEAGKIYAILGENGAGKSTLMKILSGFQTPTSGALRIDGKAVTLATPNSAIAHGIGMLYQDPQDFAPLTVLENFINGRGGGLFLGRREAQTQLTQLCRELGFKLNPNALVETLTIGERQQLEIVRLLSLGVQVLILDEPTTGISAKQRTQLFATLKRLVKERGMTVILVSHKFRDVEELCDEVMVLRKGKLVGSAILPTPTETLVEMMFGKRLEKSPRPSVPLGNPILQVEQLSVEARLFAIENVSLAVREGEVIGLAGLDGSGQVEFMRSVAGLEHPSVWDTAFVLVVMMALWVFLGTLLDESRTVLYMMRGAVVVLVLAPLLKRWLLPQHGKITLHGAPARSYRDLLAKGLVFLPAGRLEEGLVSGLTLVQHFALATRDSRPWVNWWQAWRKTENAIQTFDIRGKPAHPIQALSGGNQQRVALGMLPDALKVILLENPTRGLDVESARRIWGLLLKRRVDKTAIIFSSPDLDEILDYSDRVLVFSSGKVTLVDDPTHLTTARLGELIGGKF